MKPPLASQSAKRSPRDRVPPPQASALRWLLAAFSGALAARALLPGEGAAWLGDDLPFDLLLLAITAGYLLWATLHGRIARRGNFVDLAVAVLVVLMAGSAVFAAATTMNGPALLFGDRECEPRPVVNMLWTWIGSGLVFVLARQLVRTPREARALVGVMLAIAFTISLNGLYQLYVGLPADQAGQAAAFASAGSRTALVAAWLVIGVGICWAALQRQTDLRAVLTGGWSRSHIFLAARWAALMTGAVLVAAWLVFTENLTGGIVTLLGVALVPILMGGRGLAGAIWAGFFAAIALLFVVAVRGIDLQMLEPARELFADRLQSWQATLAMIRKYPIIGVGPGDFQDYYTQFKLVSAREELSDPHNFVLEVWATGGTLAVAALVAVLFGFAWQTGHSSAAPRGTVPVCEQLPPAWSASAGYLAAGAAVGIVLAYILAMPFGLYFPAQQLALELLAGGGALALAWPWVKAGELPARSLALAWSVLAGHLLFSGGIAFPGVASTFWILLALGLNQSDDHQDAELVEARPRTRLITLAGLILVTAAAVACYRSGLLPVLECRAAMAKAAEPHRNVDQRVALLRRAAAADPLSAEPWIAIARLELERVRLPGGVAARRDPFINATRQIVFLRRRSSATWSQIGHWYRELYALSQTAADVNTVVDMFRGAVFLAPQDSTTRGEFALALQAVDRADAARRAAQRALELDTETSRADRKLSAELRRRLKSLLAAPR